MIMKKIYMIFIIAFLSSVQLFAAINLNALKREAAKGDTISMYQLGAFYENLQPAPKYEDALYWYRLAANKGHVKSEYKVAMFFETGKGVRINYRESFKWFRKAAEEGYPDALYKLGVKYFLGKGVSKDIERANEYLKKASDAGHLQARSMLGNL